MAAAQQQDQRAEPQPKRSGALRADQWKQVLRQRCAELIRKHADQERADGERERSNVGT